MGLLQDDEGQRLIERLLRLPNIREPGVRRSLVAGLPEDLRNSVSASEVARIEVMSIVEIADGDAWGQLANESWSILRVIENAVSLVRGSKIGAELEELLNTLKSRAVELATRPAEASSASPVGQGRLSREQRKKFHTAFLNAFDLKKLEMMLLFQLDVRLRDIVAEDDFSTMVSDLIQYAEQTQIVPELINGALAANPGNGMLRSFAEEMGFVAGSPVTPPAPAQPQPETPMGKKPNRVFIDIESWRARMSEAEPAVCRVEVSDAGRGTGFLVGPSVAMTSYHVVSFLDNLEQQPISLRFGFKRSPDGITVYEGQVYQLAEDWLIDSDKALDFALLRVLGSPGDEPIGNQPGAPPRRWLNPKANHTFKLGDPMYVIQHPEAGPLKIAYDPESLVSLNPEQTLVSYRMSTAPGSAGAPCFTAEWELVAIHHSADKEAGIAMGTPMSAIVSRPKVKAALGT